MVPFVCLSPIPEGLDGGAPLLGMSTPGAETAIPSTAGAVVALVVGSKEAAFAIASSFVCASANDISSLSHFAIRAALDRSSDANSASSAALALSLSTDSANVSENCLSSELILEFKESLSTMIVFISPESLFT